MAPGIPTDVRYCSQCGQPAPLDQLARFGDNLICPNCKDIFVQKLREGVAPVQAAFQYAGFWIRFVAELIDGIILYVAGTAVQLLILGNPFRFMNTFRPNMTPDETLAAIAPMMGFFGLSFVISKVISCCYEGFFIGRVGATPGKMALSLKVVRPDGSPLTMGRAFGRYFAKWLSYITLYIGFIIAGFDAQKRGMHDMICDTRVIKNNPPAPAYPAI